jgi:hypothetical protein
MSPEEMQRMMQFLLQQQAQFAADFARSQERFEAEHTTLSAKTDRIAEGLIGLTGLVGRAIGDLAAAQQRTDDQLRTVESHLNLVIGMFEQPARRSWRSSG